MAWLPFQKYIICEKPWCDFDHWRKKYFYPNSRAALSL
jgi:hypothetical protein